MALIFAIDSLPHELTNVKLKRGTGVSRIALSLKRFKKKIKLIVSDKNQKEKKSGNEYEKNKKKMADIMALLRKASSRREKYDNEMKQTEE